LFQYILKIIISDILGSHIGAMMWIYDLIS